MKFWVSDKNFLQRKFFATKFSPIGYIYLTFMKVLNKFGSPPRQKGPGFSAVTPTNIRIRPQHFLTYSFNLFIKAVPSASSKLLNLNQEHPSKKWFFWCNPYKIEVMITSIIKMLELPNFGHMTASAM